MHSRERKGKRKVRQGSGGQERKGKARTRREGHGHGGSVGPGARAAIAGECGDDASRCEAVLLSHLLLPARARSLARSLSPVDVGVICSIMCAQVLPDSSWFPRRRILGSHIAACFDCDPIVALSPSETSCWARERDKAVLSIERERECMCERERGPGLACCLNCCASLF